MRLSCCDPDSSAESGGADLLCLFLSLPSSSSSDTASHHDPTCELWKTHKEVRTLAWRKGCELILPHIIRPVKYLDTVFVGAWIAFVEESITYTEKGQHENITKFGTKLVDLHFMLEAPPVILFCLTSSKTCGGKIKKLLDYCRCFVTRRTGLATNTVSGDLREMWRRVEPLYDQQSML